ncbi:MAG: orotidine-5'-phosphate decarboxylase [Bacteroidetes bacterium]|nr:orotidine-5'-phosphate decarboxylase [Bacteroidota bacterium]
MTRSELFQQIKTKRSVLCVGLDTDIDRIPTHLLSFDDPVFEFNKQIIDATKDYCIAYKPNLAFYEALGAKGWISLEKTLQYIPEEHFVIADAKRGDIGNTSRLYAKAFFDKLSVDAVTVAPYMGVDSVAPFLEFSNKWVVLLALTSNKGSQDFQFSSVDNKPLYSKVMQTAVGWGSPENLMFVIGATHPNQLKEIRANHPDHFFLIPGIGAQGGDLEKVMQNGLNEYGGLLINSSRGIIFAGEGEGFAKAAGLAAKELQREMERLL